MEQPLDPYLQRTLTQMRRGTLELAVLLAIARQQEAYASDIVTELERANQLIVEGTLYPLLARLREEALVSYRWEESASGPPRKYYQLTDRGKHALSALQTSWHETITSLTQLAAK
jgi:PadR family transcriptional regulator PadR